MEITNFDAYDALLFGNVDFKSKLQSGDSILIESVQNLVSVSGGVKRPGLYEMTDKETLFDLLNFSNGLSSSISAKDFLYIYPKNGEIIKKIVTMNDLKEITPVDGSGLYIPENQNLYIACIKMQYPEHHLQVKSKLKTH